MIVEGSVEEIKDRYPYKVKALALKCGDLELEVEVPDRLLEEAGVKLSKGSVVRVVLAKERTEELEECDIAYSGIAYAKKGGDIYLSFGGILAKASGSYPEWLTPGARVYLGLKF